MVAAKCKWPRTCIKWRLLNQQVKWTAQPWPKSRAAPTNLSLGGKMAADSYGLNDTMHGHFSAENMAPLGWESWPLTHKAGHRPASSDSTWTLLLLAFEILRSMKDGWRRLIDTVSCISHASWKSSGLHSLLHHLDSLHHLSVWDAPMVAWQWPSDLYSCSGCWEINVSRFCPSRSLPSHYPAFYGCPQSATKLPIPSKETHGPHRVEKWTNAYPSCRMQYAGLLLGTTHPSTKTKVIKPLLLSFIGAGIW